MKMLAQRYVAVKHDKPDDGIVGEIWITLGISDLANLCGFLVQRFHKELFSRWIITSKDLDERLRVFLFLTGWNKRRRVQQVTEVYEFICTNFQTSNLFDCYFDCLWGFVKTRHTQRYFTEKEKVFIEPCLHHHRIHASYIIM